MTLNAVDCSNYTGELSAEALAQWKASGVELVIVQAIAPPPGFPVECDRQQAQAVADAGLKLGVYVFHWQGTDIARNNAQRFASYGFAVERWWADFEDTSPGEPAQREIEVSGLLGFLDTLGGKRPAGAYSGKWWTDGYLPAGSQVFAGRAIWVAQYDNVDALQAAPLCGGTVAVHQYIGTSTLAGIPNVDLDVADPSEFTDAPAAAATRETPDDWPAQWPTWREAAINYRAIADMLGAGKAERDGQLSNDQAVESKVLDELKSAQARLSQIARLANSPSFIQTIPQIRTLAA